MPRRSKKRHVLSVLRAALGMNQTDFSEVAGCSTATIQAIEQDKFDLTEPLAARISVETGVVIKWLLTNDVSAPIPLSWSAIITHFPYVNNQPTEWNASIYKLIQDHQRANDPNAIYHAQLRGMRDLARLRAIIEGARQRNFYHLARDRLDRFLNEMEAEFVPKKGKFLFPEDVAGLGWRNLDFIRGELDSASKQFRLIHDVVDVDDPVVWNELLAFMATMETVSPYEDWDDPAVAARIKAAVEEAIRTAATE